MKIDNATHPCLLYNLITIHREKGGECHVVRTKGKGPKGLVEYALILVLVAVVVIVILALLGPAIGKIFSNIVSAI